MIGSFGCQCISGNHIIIILGMDHSKTYGGRAKYKKKNSCKGKLNEKNSCTPINPKKIFILWPKKNSFKEFDSEKKFLRLENSPSPPTPPPLPHNFSNGPSLSKLGLPAINN